MHLSKVLIHEFHYDYIKNKYDRNPRLLLTDTNSLIYEIKNEDVYKAFSKDEKFFDFSNYFDESKYYNDSSKLVSGKMKDETCGVFILGR